MVSSRWAGVTPESSVGWYRRAFDIPESDKGRRIWIEFDGAFRDVVIFVNGCFIGRNDNGYAPFRFDLTDFLAYGKKNYIVARVDASFGDGWFYEGAGIYRHVWLTKTDALNLGKWESYVRADLNGSSATLALGTVARNDGGHAESARVKWQILDASGKTVATAEAPAQSIAPDGVATFNATAKLPNPALWSVETPNLYQAIVTVEAGGKTRDAERVSFGIRTAKFTRRQRIPAERQARKDHGHLQPPGPRRRWRGSSRCVAVVPPRRAARDGRQRCPHVAQHADAGVGGSLRPHGHDDDVRDAPDELES